MDKQAIDNDYPISMPVSSPAACNYTPADPSNWASPPPTDLAAAVDRTRAAAPSR